MAELRPIVWVCNRCDTALQGGPRWCPACRYTVYRPTFPEVEEGGTEPREDRPEDPPVRVYVDCPDGSALQLLPVRGADVLEPGDDDPSGLVVLRVFHAFGPPRSVAPPVGRVRVEPGGDRNIRVFIRTYEDGFGVRRFTPASPIPHTNN